METQEQVIQLSETDLKKNMIELQARLTKAEQRMEAMEYIVAFANDIVALWPTITLRTMFKMTDKVASLKQALTLGK